MTIEKITWEKIYQIKKKIEKHDDIKSLKNFFENINNSSEINDAQKEYLTNEVEKKIRVKFPKNAKKILGNFSQIHQAYPNYLTAQNNLEREKIVDELLSIIT